MDNCGKRITVKKFLEVSNITGKLLIQIGFEALRQAGEETVHDLGAFVEIIEEKPTREEREQQNTRHRSICNYSAAVCSGSRKHLQYDC